MFALQWPEDRHCAGCGFTTSSRASWFRILFAAVEDTGVNVDLLAYRFQRAPRGQIGNSGNAE